MNIEKSFLNEQTPKEVNCAASKEGQVVTVLTLQQSEPSEFGSSSEWYQVERIVAHRVLKEDKTVELLVKWKNYSSKQNTWEPLDDFYKDVGSLVDRYFRKHGLKVQGKFFYSF